MREKDGLWKEERKRGTKGWLAPGALFMDRQEEDNDSLTDRYRKKIVEVKGRGEYCICSDGATWRTPR